MKIYTTLNKIKSYSPCTDGYKKLLNCLGKTEADNEPLALTTILESNGIEDAIWCLRCVINEYPDNCYLFVADVAESVLWLFEKKHPEDKRPREAIEAIRKYVNKEITREELKRYVYAAAAARTAASAAHAANADYDTYDAYAAYAAAHAAYDAYYADAYAAYTPIPYAADAAASAAHAAASADYDTYTSYGTEREKQKELFIKYFG